MVVGCRPRPRLIKLQTAGRPRLQNSAHVLRAILDMEQINHGKDLMFYAYRIRAKYNFLNYPDKVMSLNNKYIGSVCILYVYSVAAVSTFFKLMFLLTWAYC